MSALSALLSKAKESGAERLLVAPGETACVVEGDTRRPLAGGPVDASLILEAVSELLSQDDIRSLSSHRPRILRHEHEGSDYVLEVTRQANGIALGIRVAVRTPARPRDPARDVRPPPRRTESKPRQSKRFRAALSPPPEELPPSAPALPKAEARPVKAPISLPDLDLAVDVSDLKAVRRSDRLLAVPPVRPADAPPEERPPVAAPAPALRGSTACSVTWWSRRRRTCTSPPAITR